MTRNELISDIEMRLYGGNPSDDSISKAQIGFVIDTSTASVMSEWIRVKNNGYTPSSITTEYTRPVKKRFNTYNKTEYYIDMPTGANGKPIPLLSLYATEGLVDVVVGSQKIVRTDSIALLKNTLELKFGGKTAYYMWKNNEILLYNGQFIEGCDALVYGVFMDADKYPLVEDAREMVLNLAEETLRRELGTKQDLLDDGK